MLIGVPREIKVREYRVGLTPASVTELTSSGHRVLIETKAGLGIDATDDDYVAAGAEITEFADEIFARSELIVKVKEPLEVERKRLRKGQALFTYLHLAADKILTEQLLQSGATCIAYETVTASGGGLPLLAPMSEVAGKMSIQAAAHALEKSSGGRGVLLGGAIGVPPADVVILGGGVVGANAAAMALGMGANVTIVDREMSVLRALNARFGDALRTAFATKDTVARLIRNSDVVIIGVLIPGAAAPKLVTAADVREMRKGAVIVDVAIDQGGGAETSRPTTHDEPTYLVDGVVHYCVANMPGAVARTSTYALNNATLPFVVELAQKGVAQALNDNLHLRRGVNIAGGKLTEKHVSDALGIPYVTTDQALAQFSKEIAI